MNDDLTRALDYIDPVTLDYTEWVQVGMALKKSGHTCDEWDAWSQRDLRRYHNGECERKWSTFEDERDYGTVGSGTVIYMAKRGGYRPALDMGDALDWGDTGTAVTGPDVTYADTTAIQDADDGPWEPCAMLRDYLSALFDEDEHVCIVVNSALYEDGKHHPKGGDWSRTAGELIEELSKPGATIDRVIGECDPEAGAWVCFNPLDGNGRGNANVTEFRYALVESDTLEMERQLPAIKELHLPCAAVVSSGGKSVHAIVRVDAANDREYRSRIEWLYDYCDRHGFKTDKQNKNASRLSRLPGVVRNGRRQLLLATDIGERDWVTWKAWAEESEDDLPEAVAGDWDEPIRLSPMLIGQTDNDCILRQGQKMIVVGDSKMGKSTTLIDLAEAICVGGDWLGMQCAKGPVFYVNLEIDREEFRDRRKRIWGERPESFEPESFEDVKANFVVWHMRGHATVLEELAPRLVRRVLGYGPPGTFKAVIIDPIYKVNGGDDNDAKAVARFTNTLDLIMDRCGCATIYAHHHPKGATGGRKSIDRMSGSGVYGRDADTVIDFSPLFVAEDTWAEFDHKPCYRAEVTCRSFGYRRPIDIIFVWPRFIRDHSGKLAGCKVLGEDPKGEARARGSDSTKAKSEADGWNKLLALNDAFDNYPHDVGPELVEFGPEFVETVRWGAFGVDKGVNANTITKWIDGTSDAKFSHLIREHFEFVGKGKAILRRVKVPEE